MVFSSSLHRVYYNIPFRATGTRNRGKGSRAPLRSTNTFGLRKSRLKRPKQTQKRRKKAHILLYWPAALRLKSFLRDPSETLYRRLVSASQPILSDAINMAKKKTSTPVEDDSSDTEDFSNSEDEEGKSSYKKGGYHAVVIGDVYNNRYVVHKKLGWGHFSTVWLATDSKVDIEHPHKCVALKIQKSASQYTEAAEDEIELLTTIKKEAGTSGSKYCVLLLNHFKIHGQRNSSLHGF